MSKPCKGSVRFLIDKARELNAKRMAAFNEFEAAYAEEMAICEELFCALNDYGFLKHHVHGPVCVSPDILRIDRFRRRAFPI